VVQQPRLLDVYARVSRVGDERQRSTQGQVEDCTARIAERGAELGEIHIDKGRSAWNPRVRRPGWDRLMARLEAGATGGVVVFDLARFSRRPIEGERLIAAAERGLLVLDSEDEYDLTSASGKKAFRDQLSSAAYESDRLSTRVKRGKRLKARRGESNASWRAYGFNRDGSIREDEAAVLREVADRFLVGESLDALVIELNRRRIRTSTGGHWTRAGLKQVLTRPRNAGVITYGGKPVSKVDGPTLFDPATHERIVAMFAARKRGRPISQAYLASGVAHCGLCGHRLSGRPRVTMKPYPDGSVRRQYHCQPRAFDGGCGKIAVDQRDLDNHLGELVVAILSDPRHAAAIEAAAHAAADQRQTVESEIAELEQLGTQLAERLGRGEISLARYDAASAPLDRRLTELKAKLTDLDTRPDLYPSPAVVAASKATWRRRWAAATIPERRTLLRQALRGRRLVVNPADPQAPRRFDPMRITVDENSR
jgi:site-specific DNA recombinase